MGQASRVAWWTRSRDGRMRWAGPTIEPARSAFLSERQARQRLVGRDAFLGPAAQLVVLGKHRGEAVYETLGRTCLRRLRDEARRQVVVLVGEAGAVVEDALHVPDALADFHHVLGRPAGAVAGGIDLGCDVVQRPGEGREDAQAGGVDGGGRILEGLDQGGLAVGGQRVGLLRDAEDFGRDRVGAQVAGAAVGRGVGEAHALDPARVVGGEFLALDGHGEVRATILGA